jgi:pimeloyl-ACP methyl ester carboxylesterase
MWSGDIEIVDILGTDHTRRRGSGLDRALSRLRVNGVELECVDEGRGVPIVFSHGSGSDIRYWEPQRAVFAERYRFVAYGRRFHGPGSWSSTGDNSAEAHVADLLAIIRRLAAGSVHLVGFSTAIALRAVLERPDLIGTLTIVEPNVPWLLQGDAEGEAVIDWWRHENDRVRAESGGDAALHAELWFELVNNRGAGAFGAQPAAFRDMWIENMTLARPPAREPSPLTCDRLRAIPVPTLVVGAEHGMPYSRLIVERLVSCVPDSQLVVVPGVTHFMSYQAPAIFNEMVLAFINGYGISSPV